MKTQRRCDRNLTALLLLVAGLSFGCGAGDPGTAIGERWYIVYGSSGFNMDYRGSKQRLERDGAKGRVVVDQAIEKYRFYPPDCVLYQTGLRHHQVLAVCGDRIPVPLEYAVSLEDWSLDDDAVRRVNPPWNHNGRFLERHEVLPLGDVIARANAQPPFRENWAASVSTDARMESLKSDHPANLREKDPQTGDSPLMPLVRAGRLDLVEPMLAAGADVNQANNLGWTPLMAAADDWGRSDGTLVTRLIAAGARLDTQNNAGETALMIAARHGSIIVVQKLLAAGANASLRNKDGRTAAALAADQSNPELIRILREAER